MTVPDKKKKAQIARINEISALARTSWIGLLAYLAFVFVTLLGVEDADFFVPSRQTQLPLVNVSIPTASFFVFAPILAAALYIYLHLFLLKLWDAIAKAPPTIDGQPLGDVIHPWLVNDVATFTKNPAAFRNRPLRWFTYVVTALLVWISGPFVIGWAWWRSFPAHDNLLTLAIAASLIFATLVGLTSARIAVGRYRNRWWKGFNARRRNITTTLAIILVITFGMLRTDRTMTIRPADLAGVKFVPLPADWRNTETARRDFRETWCKREGLAMDICGQLPHAAGLAPEHVILARQNWCSLNGGKSEIDCTAHFAYLNDRFDADWEDERASAFSNLPTPDLAGRDLRRASAAEVSLVGANLIGARLEEADLWHALLVGADLSYAHLEAADLRGAQLEAADLREARLEGADLFEAQLGRANLGEARLEGADLRGAGLGGADLSAANLEGANFTWAWLVGAHFSGSRLQGASFAAAQLQSARLWNAPLEGTDLRGAGLEGADLSAANLEGADLRGARLEGTDLRDARLEGLAQDADLRGARNLTQGQLDRMIGNAQTLLPLNPGSREPFQVWTCWDQPPDFFERMLATWQARGVDEVDIRDLFLCGPDNPRRPTGTPLALDAPYPEGHQLAIGRYLIPMIYIANPRTRR